jgi:SWI/SNF-related matrix-associated actin-dependent regulator 1 of chromatin subfamily A
MLREMTAALMTEPEYADNAEYNPEFIYEDLGVMTDFELDRFCRQHATTLAKYAQPADSVLDSAKLRVLRELLVTHKADGDRVLIFSQFVMMLDILEVFLTKMGHRYLRIDGSTSVADRQKLIDQYTDDGEILVFLLSTRAGGVGINLTAANVVILHDIDYNPHQDRQAEARCHRVGQTRPVTITRLICKNTVEEIMLEMSERKLTLDDDMTTGLELSREEVLQILEKNASMLLATVCGTHVGKGGSALASGDAAALSE